MDKNEIKLVKFTSKDSWRYVKVCNHHAVKALLHPSVKKHYHKNTLKSHFYKFLTHWNKYFYKIEYQNKFIGTAFITEYYCDENKNYTYDKSTIGYALYPKYSGNGIMSIAVNKLLEEYFQDSEAKPIMASVHQSNGKSASVLLKNNFKHLETKNKIMYFEKTINQV